MIQMDGNGFGGRQKGFTTPEELKDWDKTLKDYKRAFLKRLVVEAKKDDNRKAWTNRGRVRLEVLVWGGDDVRLVAPAWLGWRMLELFSEESAAWDYPQGTGNLLTHSVGMVLAHSNAPIHRLAALADRLAEEAKGDKKKSMLRCQVLESFDNYELASGHERPRSRLALADLERIRELANSMAAYFPRRKLVALAKAAVDGPAAGTWEDYAKRVLEEETPRSQREEVEELERLLGGRNEAWVQLSELWDYVVEE